MPRGSLAAMRQAAPAFFSALLTLMPATDAFAQPHDAESRIAEIVYAGDASFPPYEYLDERGEPAGLNVDLIRAVGRARGIRVRVHLVPWKQVPPGLLSGEYDVASMYRSPQRARVVDFAIPHELIFHEMFVRAGSPAIHSLQELAGKRALVEVGTYSEDALRELGFGADVLPMASEPEALRALARGEGDVALVTQAVGRPFEQRTSLGKSIVVTGPPVLLSEYAFVTRKDQRPLIELLNEGVASVKADGEYARIYDRWIRPDRSAQRVRIIAWTLAGTVFVALLVIVWNQSLRRRVAEQTKALRREFEERERTRAALAESEKMLRQSQKMETVGRLAGGIAHDFNNILTVILNYAHLLGIRLARDGVRAPEVDEILSASERASRLTKQLLTFSRSTPAEVAPLNLAVVLRDLTGMVRRLVGEHIRVEVTLPSSPVVVTADASQIEQAILNLAANARDAMPSGGQLLLAVDTRALSADNPYGLAAGDYASIDVTDTGVGMDAETLAHAFEPFFTTKEVGKGTGMGLATVFAALTKLNGTVTVESASGVGTTFHLLLPRQASEPDVATPPSTRTTRAPLGKGETILLVEDDDALRRSARIALQQSGYDVVEATDGEHGAEVASRGTRFSLVVTDVVMPRRGGPQLVAELRRGRADPLRVLYVSGYVADGMSLDLSAPGTAFLPKPYSPETLVVAVQELLKQPAA